MASLADSSSASMEDLMAKKLDSSPTAESILLRSFSKLEERKAIARKYTCYFQAMLEWMVSRSAGDVSVTLDEYSKECWRRRSILETLTPIWKPFEMVRMSLRLIMIDEVSSQVYISPNWW